MAGAGRIVYLWFVRAFTFLCVPMARILLLLSTMKPLSGLRAAGRAWRAALAALLVILLLLGPVACGRPRQGQERVVPLQVVEGPRGAVLALVPVFVAGQGPFAFALDTGASQSLVDQALAQDLSLPVIGRTRELTGVAGAIEADVIRVDEWRAGDVDLPATTAVSLELPQTNRDMGLRGLLGSDVLSRFGAITVDYEREVLILRSRR